MKSFLSNPVVYFAAATLVPVPLLLAAALFGGGWILMSLLYLALFSFAMDEWTNLTLPAQQDSGEVPTAEQLGIALGIAHFLLLLAGLLALSGVTGLGWSGRFGVIVAFGLFFGQISNSNAHELIHSADKNLFLLGKWVYISLLFGHHTSAHRLVHHRYVATGEDPATADLDEGFYDYAQRAWRDGFRAGYQMEQALTSRAEGKGRVNPYVIYVAGAVCFLLLTLVIFGVSGLFGYLLMAAFAQTQLLLSDYVQHYGLLRRRLPGGKVEQVGIEHSWNAPHWFTALTMLNAPRHSDHHLNPKKGFVDLRLPVANSAPTLPYSLPLMCTIALYPPYWRQMMSPRAKAWRNTPLRAAEVETDVVEA